MNDVILEVNNLTKHFPIFGGVFSRKKGDVRAVQDVSFKLKKGETLGLVGESGCGKSTLARTIIRLEEATSGEVIFQGKDLLNCSRKEMFKQRRDIQMIFQDPYSSLNPRMTVGEIVREPLTVHKIGKRSERRDKVVDLFESVGLSEDMVNRYPHEFSGGQRQRVGIARALALQPRVILADEPVSALDVSVQAQVINLLVRLQKEFDLTYVFISHDLSVVEYISDSIAIMYLGRIVEIGSKEEIWNNHAHPYTHALLEAVPLPDPRIIRKKIPVRGETPSPSNPPAGCAFHPRCEFTILECSKSVPVLEPFKNNPNHLSACIRKEELQLKIKNSK